jgi:hypothetical protein
MKKSLLLLSSIFCLASTSSDAQTVNNAGFETWHNYNVMTATGFKALQAPNGWMGLDSFLCAASLFGSIAGIDVTPAKQVYESSDASEGNKAVMLKTAYLGDEIGYAPGAVFNAKANIDLLGLMGNPDLENIMSMVNFSGGTPLEGRKLDHIKAWVKNTAATPDKGIAFATAFQKSQTSAGADTMIVIGAGTMDIDNELVGEYFEITVPVSYTDENNTAIDTVVIGFMSASVPTDSTGALLVDDVTLTTSTGNTIGIVEPALASTGMVVYPNPSTNMVNFNLYASFTASDYVLIITDALGKVVSEETLKQTINAKEVGTWARGVYFYSLTNTRTTQQIKGQFILN